MKYWGVYKITASLILTSFMFFLLTNCSSFPSRPLLPIICQKLCRFLSLKTCCIQNLRPFSLPSTPPSIPPSLPKNGWPQLHLGKHFTLTLSVFLFPLSSLSPASLKVDLTGRRDVQGWRVRECVCINFLVSLLGWVCLCWYVSVYWLACVSTFTCLCVCTCRCVRMPSEDKICVK